MNNLPLELKDGSLTAVAETHHILENLLARPDIRKLLGWISSSKNGAPSLFERLCENYDRRGLPWRERWKWLFPSLLIDLALKRAGLDKELMKKKLFHHHPTVRALNLTARSIGRYGLNAPQRFAAPLFAVWNITQACNLRCKHCYQNASARPAPDELTLAEKLDVVDQLAAAGTPFLAIAGGEPLVCRDLWAVLEHATRRGIHLSLATNGTLLSPRNVQRLIEAGVKYVEASIDSLEPGEHDEFRGQSGSWARSIEGIRNSVSAGMRTGFAMCFTRDNVHRADEAIQFAIDLGCQTFSHFNFIPVGRGRDVVEYDLTPGQREQLMAVLFRRLQEGKINIISTAPQFARACVTFGSADGLFATGHVGTGRGSKTMVLSRYIGGCGSGRCYCAIQPNGDVTPCVYIPFESIGNLRNQRLAEVWECPLFESLSDRDQRGGHCRICGYRAYCGGCRARALAYTGDIQAGDPGCSFNQDLWDRLTRDALKAEFVQIGVPAGRAVKRRAEGVSS